jgi:hypothetical protein
MEKDIRQDQPLWAYSLAKLGVAPLRLGGKKSMFFTYHDKLAPAEPHRFVKTDENIAVE